MASHRTLSSPAPESGGAQQRQPPPQASLAYSADIICQYVLYAFVCVCIFVNTSVLFALASEASLTPVTTANIFCNDDTSLTAESSNSLSMATFEVLDPWQDKWRAQLIIQGLSLLCLHGPLEVSYLFTPCGFPHYLSVFSDYPIWLHDFWAQQSWKGGPRCLRYAFSHKRKVKPFEAILGGHDYHPGEGITRSATLFTSFPQTQTINNLHQTDPRLLSAPRTIARSEEHLGLVFVWQSLPLDNVRFWKI